MITHKSIASLTSGKVKFLNDGKGLIAKRLPSGSVVWVARKMANGKRQSVTLGRYPDIGIAEAREKAREFLASVAPHPKEEHDTVRDVYEWWHRRHAPKLRNPREVERCLSGFLGKFGEVRFAELDSREVFRYFEEYTAGGTQRLNAARKAISYAKLLEKVAITLGHAEHSKLSGLNLLIPPANPKPMPSVPPDELAEVLGVIWQGHRRSRTMPDLVMTGLYTLLRPGEYRKMEWDWIDFDEAVITVPAEIMKMGKEHRVPISVQLHRLLMARHVDGAGRFVFPSEDRPQGYVSTNTLSTWFRRHGLKGRLSPHGIRSIGRSWLAENGIGFEVAELCLAHEVGSNVERRYNRTDLFAQRRAAMQAWSDYVEQCLKASLEGMKEVRNLHL